MMCVPRMSSDDANERCTADVTSGNASPGAVAYTWSPMRATVDDVPRLPKPGPAVYDGATSERLIVKICPAGQSHVPVPLLEVGSFLPPGQPIGPPGWLHDIAARRPEFSAGVENDCEAASSVVLLMRWAWASARIIALVMKRPCSATSSYSEEAPIASWRPSVPAAMTEVPPSVSARRSRT